MLFGSVWMCRIIITHILGVWWCTSITWSVYMFYRLSHPSPMRTHTASRHGSADVKTSIVGNGSQCSVFQFGWCNLRVAHGRLSGESAVAFYLWNPHLQCIVVHKTNFLSARYRSGYMRSIYKIGKEELSAGYTHSIVYMNATRSTIFNVRQSTNLNINARRNTKHAESSFVKFSLLGYISAYHGIIYQPGGWLLWWCETKTRQHRVLCYICTCYLLRHPISRPPRKCPRDREISL